MIDFNVNTLHSISGHSNVFKVSKKNGKRDITLSARLRGALGTISSPPWRSNLMSTYNSDVAEADLAIECKKLYGQQFDASLMPAEQREWYEKSGLGIHYMYIGEIIHVWKK